MEEWRVRSDRHVNDWNITVRESGSRWDEKILKLMLCLEYTTGVLKRIAPPSFIVWIQVRKLVLIN